MRSRVQHRLLRTGGDRRRAHRLGADRDEQVVAHLPCGRGHGQGLGVGEHLPLRVMARQEVAERLGHADDLDEAPAQVAVRLQRRDQPPPGRLVAGLEDAHEQEQRLVGVGGHPDVHEHVAVRVLAGQQRLQPRRCAQAAGPVEVLEPQADEPTGVGAAPGAHESRRWAHTRSPHARVTGRQAAMRSPSAASTSSATTRGSMPERPSASSG